MNFANSSIINYKHFALYFNKYLLPDVSYTDYTISSMSSSKLITLLYKLLFIIRDKYCYSENEIKKKIINEIVYYLQPKSNFHFTKHIFEDIEYVNLIVNDILPYHFLKVIKI